MLTFSSKCQFFLSVSNALALSLRSTIDCDKPFQAAMTRRMKLCLRTFVQKNGRIKYLECMCLVLRVGVDKCCKGRADRESRPLLNYISVLASLRLFSDCQPRTSDRWCVVEPGSKF